MKMRVCCSASLHRIFRQRSVLPTLVMCMCSTIKIENQKFHQRRIVRNFRTLVRSAIFYIECLIRNTTCSQLLLDNHNSFSEQPVQTFQFLFCLMKDYKTKKKLRSIKKNPEFTEFVKSFRIQKFDNISLKSSYIGNTLNKKGVRMMRKEWVERKEDQSTD